MRKTLRFAIVLAACLAPTAVSAQTPAEELQHAEDQAARAEGNELQLQLTAGASFAYGNARNIAINLGGRFSLRENEHALLIELGWIYGLASVRLDPAMMMYAFGDYAENTNNFTGRLRYDYFVTPDDALFVALRIRNDPFANLEPRFGGQVGYLRNLFREEKHRLWVEIGVDATYDNFGELLAIGPGVTTEDRFIFSWRAFVGYSNELTDALTYVTGLEVLGEVARAPGAIEPGHIRFEWVNRLASKIENWLQISLDLIGRLDSQPAGQQQPWEEEPIVSRATDMLDLLATLNLVGNFDLAPAPVAEEAPACPECPVCVEPTPCPEPIRVTDDVGGANNGTIDEGGIDGETGDEDTGDETETPTVPDTTADDPEPL